MKKEEAHGASLFVFAGQLDFVTQSIETWIASAVEEPWRNTRKS